MFAAGGPLAWQSKLQTTVATSSMQSEYQAMYAGMQEIVWLRVFLAKLDLWLSELKPFFLDSQSAEDLALNPVYHKWSKHIEIKYHLVREHADSDSAFSLHVIGMLYNESHTISLSGSVDECTM